MGKVRDPRFRGLAGALDPEEACTQIAAALPECREAFDLEHVRIYDVQYKPGDRCILLYSLKLRDRTTERSVHQLLSAELLAEGERPSEMPQGLATRHRSTRERPLAGPLVHVAPLDMVAYPFPVDPRLPQLLEAFDPEAMKLRLGQMWRQRGVRPLKLEVKSLGYTPFARAALLYEVLSESRSSGLPEIRHLVGKIDAQREAADLFARSWAAWRAANHRIRLAPPVGYLPDLNLFLQERVDGERLSDMAGTASFASLIRSTARSVAVLHGLELPLGSRRPPELHAKAVHRWGRMLAGIRPGSKRRVLELTERIAAELERRSQITGPVHGDLHPSNILVSGRRVTLIDLDNMMAGDRLQDVGRFLSALRTSSLRVYGTPDGLAEAGESFLERYLALTDEDESRVRLFEAASLLISAGTGFRLQREGWERSADALIEEVEQALTRASRGPSQSLTSKPKADGGRTVQSAWAGDGLYLRAVLDPHFRRVFDAELVDCNIERRWQSSRAEHLRYRLCGQRHGGRMKVVLEGVLRSGGRSGRSVLRRMESVQAALTGNPQALRLPRPIVYLGEIGLQVLDVPEGGPLSPRLDGPEGPGLVGQLARGLWALHGTSVELDKTRSLDEEIQTLRTRIRKLRRAPREVIEGASQLVDALASSGLADLERRGPVVRHVSPRRLVVMEDRLGLTEVDDVVLSHPHLDVADFVGRMLLEGLKSDRAAKFRELAEEFRQVYLSASGGSADELALFEALTLTRIGCTEAERRPRETLGQALLETAMARMGASSTP